MGLSHIRFVKEFKSDGPEVNHYHRSIVTLLPARLVHVQVVVENSLLLGGKILIILATEQSSSVLASNLRRLFLPFCAHSR